MWIFLLQNVENFACIIYGWRLKSRVCIVVGFFWAIQNLSCTYSIREIWCCASKSIMQGYLSRVDYFKLLFEYLLHHISISSLVPVNVVIIIIDMEIHCWRWWLKVVNAVFPFRCWLNSISIGGINIFRFIDGCKRFKSSRKL